MLEKILLVLATAAIVSLVNFFINSYGKKNSLHGIAREKIEVHEQVKHQDDVRTYTKNAIDFHKANCIGASDMKEVKKIVTAIYVKQGGNIEELKL